METPTQISATFLPAILTAQSLPSAVDGQIQPADYSEKFNAPPFLAAFELSLKSLLGATQVDKAMAPSGQSGLINTATASPELPLTEGQEIAAAVPPQEHAVELSQEQLDDLLAQLKTLGYELSPEQLVTLVYADARMTASVGQQNNSVVSSLLAQNPSSDPAYFVNAQVTSDIDADKLIVNAGMDVKRLLQRLNTVLSGNSLQAGIVVGANRPSLGGSGLDAASNQQASISQSLLEPMMPQTVKSIPAMLERFANITGDQIPRNESLDTTAKYVDASSGLQVSRAVSNTTAAAGDARLPQSLIQTPLDDSGWRNDFSNKVFMMTRGMNQGQMQVAELRLNPQHMGAIEVRVVMKDDQASVSFVSQHGVVRDAIESSLPRLREMLNSSGLVLADTDVSEQSLQNRQQHDSHTSSERSDTHSELLVPLDQSVFTEADLASVSTSTLLSGLDLYA